MPDIIEITDLNDDRIGLFTRLTEAQLRNRLEPEKGIFIAESAKVVRLALEMGCEPVAYLMERRQLTNQGREFIETRAACQYLPPMMRCLKGSQDIGSTAECLPQCEGLSCRASMRC